MKIDKNFWNLIDVKKDKDSVSAKIAEELDTQYEEYFTAFRNKEIGLYLVSLERIRKEDGDVVDDFAFKPEEFEEMIRLFRKLYPEGWQNEK